MTKKSLPELTMDLEMAAAIAHALNVRLTEARTSPVRSTDDHRAFSQLLFAVDKAEQTKRDAEYKLAIAINEGGN